nr:uncharacterized mitochondrial protein AtMg00810-like [Tanacetum cinerariifolium]
VINTVSSPVSTGGLSFVNDASQIPLNAAGPFANDTRIFSNAYDDDILEEEVDINNVDSSYVILEAIKFLKDHPQEQVIGSLETPIQTRHMSKTHEEFGLLSLVHKLRRTNNKDFQNYLFACFLSQMEPKKPVQALQDPSWVKAMQEELLQFKLGQIDKTLFIISHKDDTLLVQVYVDDIIIGSTKKELSTEFEKLMHDKFQMSSMRELFFLLGLQIKQKSDEIFISQDKYVAEILKKFDFVTVKTASTLMESNKPLIKDEEAEDVDVYLYRSLIGSLMYLTASMPDITFAVCACARFQVTPKTSHLHAVKRIFRYLKGQPKLGLWYPKDSPFDLEAYSDSDYAGASLDRKSTTGGCQFLGKRLISWQCKKQTIVANSTTEAEYVAAANCCGQVLVKTKDGRCFVDTSEVTNGNTLLSTAGLTTTGQRVNNQEHIQALIDKKKVIITEDSIRSDLRFDDAEGTVCLLNERKEAEISHDESKDEDHVPTPSSDPLPSGEDSYTLNKLIVFCTSLKSRSGGLRRLMKISLGRRVRSSLEKDSLGAQEDASKQGRMIEEIDQDDKITLDVDTQGRKNDDEICGVDDLSKEEVVLDTTTGEHKEQIIKDVSTAKPVNTTGEVVTIVDEKDKGKAKMIEPEVPIKKKDQIKMDEEYAKQLKVEEQEEETLCCFESSRKEKQTTHKSINEKSNVYLSEKYGWIQTLPLKGNELYEIKELFDREMKKVNNFIAMDSKAQKRSRKEAQESGTKITAESLESDISKKQKVDKNVKLVINDIKKLKKCMEIVPDNGDDLLIEATPLSSRSPTIIDYKIHKEGKKTYFKIIKADIKDRFKKEKPVDDMDNLLFRCLKTMFEHHVEDVIWTYQKGLAKVNYNVEMAYDLLRFIIKQLMEVKNGNKVLTKPVGSNEQTYEPTIAEEKQDRRNEMKARGTLFMALPNKDQLKFHSYQDAKLLMEAIEKRIIKHKSKSIKYGFCFFKSTSSTNEADTTASGVSAAHTQGNKCYLTDFEAYDGGFVSFRDGKGRISGKGKIKTGKLDFDDVYFCKELKYNMFSVSQMCDKKNNVFFTDTECLVLSSNFKLHDESQVLLRVPRKDNIYSVDLKSVVPTGGLTCLFAKATLDESNLWHTRLRHINFKTMNKLVKGNLLYEDKDIKREYSVARTPQQNRVTERRNKTLTEAARTMSVDSKLPTTFWAEVVNIAGYVLNRALVTKPYNKTPYELIRERPPLIDFMKPFGCPDTILNTRDNLGKFEGKADEGYFVGNGPDWLFDIYSLTISMKYVPVGTRNQTNGIAGTKENLVACQVEKKKELEQEYILIPICTTNPLISQDAKDSAEDAGKKAPEVAVSEASNNGGQDNQVSRSEDGSLFQQDRLTEHNNSTNDINTVSSQVSTDGSSFVNAASQTPINAAGPSANAYEEHSFERFSPFKNAFSLPHVPMVTLIDDTGIFGNAYDDDVLQEEVDMNNVDSSYTIPEATKNKKDEREIVIKNKARLVAQGHTQEEEEVYVYQPPGFEDLNVPDKVYKVEKALYGLHQAPRAWYETLLTYLHENGFHKELSTEFEKLMHDKFQMSSMGELSFFLGLQVKQKSDGIFINQDKYVAQILKKFDFDTTKTASTPMKSDKPLIKDEEAEDVDVHLYRSMIGSLIYLTASRLDITFSTIVVNSTTEVEYVAAANCCRQNPVFHSKTKHTEIRHHFIRDAYEKKLIQVIKIHIDKNVADLHTKAFDVSRVNDQEQIQALVNKKKVIITEDNIRSDLYLDDAEGTACLLNEAIFEGLARMGRKQRKEAKVSHDESEDEDHVPTPSSDPLPSGEDSYTLNELMIFCTSLQEQVLDLQEAKDAQSKKIAALKKKERMIKEIDQDDEVALDDNAQGRINADEMFGVDDLAREEVVLDTTTSEHEEQIIEDVSTAEPVTTFGEVVTTAADKVSAALTTDVTEDEITIAQALVELKSTKPKVVLQEQEVNTTIPAAATIVITAVLIPRAKGIVFHEQKQLHIPTFSSSKDKGKAKMIELEVSIKKKDQIRIDEEYSRKLEAKEQEAARLRRAQQDEKANIS